MTTFKEEIIMLIAAHKKNEASEKIVSSIENKVQIYTTRDDDKPEIWIYKDGIYVPQGQTFILEFCRDLLGELFTRQICNLITDKIKADTFIDPQEFFEKEEINEIAVENGILNLETREITDFTPNKIFFSKIPVKYDPKAVCPCIDKYFSDVLKEPGDIIVMYELIGFLLHKEYTFEKAFMFIGEGRNGKGKTLKLINTFLGAENVSSVPLQNLEIDQYAAGYLHKKLANLAGDLDSKSLKHTGRFKELTGRDMITSNRKYKQPIYFENYSKLVFACNKLPRTLDLTTAFFDRWIVFEYPYYFAKENEFSEEKGHKKADPNIVKQLITPEELSGLLNKALDGLDRIKQNKGFSTSKGIDDVKRLWIRKSDSFMAFLMDCIDEAEPTDRIEKQILRQEYSKYCKFHKLKMISDKWIRDSLFEAFPVSEIQDSDSGHRYWEGIKFKDGVIS